MYPGNFQFSRARCSGLPPSCSRGGDSGAAGYTVSPRTSTWFRNGSNKAYSFAASLAAKSEQLSPQNNKNKTMSCPHIPRRGISCSSEEKRLPPCQGGDVTAVRLQGIAVCQSRAVAHMCSSPVDFIHYSSRVQTTVRYETTKIQ